MKQAAAFLTIVGHGETPSPGALAWFPVVGALVGCAVGGVWWGAAQWFPLPVAGALAVAADLAVTGLLHVDGLADSADGLLPPVSRDRRLVIMRDPHAGVFGVVAVVVVLLLRVAVLGSIVPGSIRAALVIGAIWCTSRAAMAVIATTTPYARDDGLASAFVGGRPGLVILVATPLAVALGALGTDPHVRCLLAVAACAIAAAVVATFARTRLGGFTGDVLGAAGVVGETVGLIVLAAHS
jgi:adenosylcobinamide-GDP ribazoletransferase